jgi:phosphate starvation-inducible membrane PsiE
MNKVSAINALQGLISVFLAFVYFTSGNRITTISILLILFLISLFSISYSMSRRKRWAEITEIVVYFLFFGFSFMGVDNFKSLGYAQPVPNWFWIAWAVGIAFNWGEFIGKIMIKLSEKEVSEG